MRTIITIVTIMMLLTLPAKGYSKTYAYLFAKDEVIKIDTETDSIITRVKSSIELQGYIGEFKEAGCVVDLANKYLITLSDTGEIGRPGFYIYDLLTLKQIKFVTFPEIIKEPTNMKIVYLQKEAKFYIEIDDMNLNNGQGGVVNLAYDKKTQNYIGTVSNVLNELREAFWFLEDQSKIYVESAEGNGLRIYDSQVLKLLNTVDLSNVYAKNLWGKSIDDIKNAIVLLGENNKLQKADKNNMSFLTYNIADRTTSPRVVTGMDNETTLLTPDARKVIFNETQGITWSECGFRHTRTADPVHPNSSFA